MSGIEQFADKAAFVSARVNPYHRLGTVLEDTFDAATALEKAHLKDWNVRKEPMFVHLPDGTQLETGNAFGSLRTNPFNGETEYLGAVGRTWHPFQNEEQVEFLDHLVDQSGAHFETAGSLWGGRETFVQMRMPEHINIGGIDPLGTYISALNRHDGRGSFRVIVGAVRIECTNTQAAALRNAKASFSVMHTKTKVANALSEARQALELSFKYLDTFQQEAEKMIQATMNEAQFKGIIEHTFGKIEEGKNTASENALRKTHDSLMELFVESPTAQTIKGTRWAGYQAITEYVDHFSPVKTKGDTDYARALRAVGDKGVEVKAKAFQLLTV